MRLNAIINSMVQELNRAEKIHPNYPEDKIHGAAILGEEAGELLQAAIDYEYRNINHVDYIKRMKEEAIQTGAMAIRFLMNLDEF
jgi:hypothetical protein